MNREELKQGFRIGRAYKRQDILGRTCIMRILGEINTTVYGKCLIAEKCLDYGDAVTMFTPVNLAPEATLGWSEIPLEEWDSYFGD